MKLFILNLSKFVLVLLVIFSTSCGDDDGDGEEANVIDLLIGTWTTDQIVSVTTSVDGQSILDYLVNEVGMSPTDAAVREALIQSALEQEVTGTLTINADNTYESMFAGGMDSGTWSLSADETTLTMFEGPDTIIITINSITATRWDASTGDTIMLDLDGDAGTPEEEVEASANVIFTK